MVTQLSLPWGPTALPPGFRLVPDVLSVAEEADALARVEHVELAPFVMRGQPSRRLVASFGVDYRAPQGAVVPLPDWLAALRDRAADAADQRFAPFVQALVTVYPPGAGIGWHKDYPIYGPVVLGLSLGATCRFRLRHAGEVVAVELPRRSLYVLGGDARRTWEHQIPAVAEGRVSITFRTRKGSERYT